MSSNTKKSPLVKSSRLRASATQSATSALQKQDVPEGAIRKLSEILKSTDLAEIEVSTEKMTIRVRAKEMAAGPLTYTVAAAPTPTAPVVPTHAQALSKPGSEPQADSHLHIIRSPFVGTFYRAPSPNSPPFVEVGQAVSKGQTLGIVEAMKLMNEIEADASGIVEKIYVDNSTPVEFNTPLFALKTV